MFWAGPDHISLTGDHKGRADDYIIGLSSTVVVIPTGGSSARTTYPPLLLATSLVAERMEEWGPSKNTI